MTTPPRLRHSSHWGAFEVSHAPDGRLRITPFADDPDPSILLGNMAAGLEHPARLSRPLIREGWLRDGPGPDPRRGGDRYIPVDWDEALERTAAELRRLGAGPDAASADPLPGAHVFGGSYGWASAGRFHHAQSQLHRFLNMTFGGYVGGHDTYSTAAGTVILKMVWGDSVKLTRDHPYLQELADDTELLIGFGGLPLRNTAVSGGGNSQHLVRGALEAAARRGCRFVSVSPLDDDMPDLPGLIRLRPRPGTDVALMLGVAHRLHEMGQIDHAHLQRHAVGAEKLLAYVTGQADGVPKDASWAAPICDIAAEQIVRLAEMTAGRRTLINVTYSLQRAENGEQPVWMALALAAMLGGGQRPGAGFCYGLGSIGNIGKQPIAVPLPTLPQGQNKVTDAIPVARIADMLLHPGQPYAYMGEPKRYPDIRLIYWAGGNPFHHHQDLSRLSAAFARPETIIVHDSVGTASAAHADIVFPATVTAERRDIGAAGNDPFMVAMDPLAPPYGQARDDHAIFAALAERLGCGARFTEGLDAEGWLRRLYEPTRVALLALGHGAPSFEAFMQDGVLQLPLRDSPGMIRRFHDDPERHPLPTPSGRIELYSDRVAAAGLPGHPAWIPPTEWLGGPAARRHPFQLIANQPARRLHSQLDFGPVSMAGKRAGREIVQLYEEDARRLGIAEGEIVRIWNDRGALLAIARSSLEIRPGVIQVPTEAWFAPEQVEGDARTCVNGNPNTVTRDAPASILSQGCTGQLSLVSISRLDGPVPAARPHEAVLQVKADGELEDHSPAPATTKKIAAAKSRSVK